MERLGGESSRWEERRGMKGGETDREIRMERFDGENMYRNVL